MQSTYTLLVDFDDLKNLGFIDENLNETKGNILIKTIQDIHIQSALSTQLYRELLRQVELNNIMPQYGYLIDEYIIFAIGYYVKAQLCVDNNFKLRQNALAKMSDTNSDYSNLKEVNYVKQENEDKGEWYVNRLIKYLNDNKTIYPEWNVQVQPSDIIASTGGFSFGLKVGKKY